MNADSLETARTQEIDVESQQDYARIWLTARPQPISPLIALTLSPRIHRDRGAVNLPKEEAIIQYSSFHPPAVEVVHYSGV